MTAQHRSEGATGVLSRPEVDIAELVGDMPAQPCQCGINGCNGTKHQHGCDHRARWVVRVHGKTDTEHGDFILNLCDECLRVARAIKAETGNCKACGKSWSMLVLPL